MSAKVVKIKEEPLTIGKLVEIKEQKEEIDGFVTKSPIFHVLKIDLKSENNDCGDEIGEIGTKSSKTKNKILSNKPNKSKRSVSENYRKK